jgi:hypothetical protein
MIIGPGSAAWEVIRDLVNHLPVMVTPRWVSSRSTPIALSNLLRYLADAPLVDETAGEIYDVGGAEDLTYEEIMRQYAELVGKKPYIIPVGVLTPRLSSYWLNLVTSVPTNIARALIDGLSQDVIADDDRLADLVSRVASFNLNMAFTPNKHVPSLVAAQVKPLCGGLFAVSDRTVISSMPVGSGGYEGALTGSWVAQASGASAAIPKNFRWAMLLIRGE